MTEQDLYLLLQLSRGLADAPAAGLRSEAHWLQEAKANIEAALARIEKERRHAA